MKHIASISLFLLLGAPALRAQTVSDAIRYSYLQPTGTARYVGVGGAFTALGAEFSSASNNPAGMAMFRQSELAITPGLKFNRTDAAIAGNETFDDTKSAFYLDHLGIVFNTTPASKRVDVRSGKQPDIRGWQTFNVGIGVNRVANFNQTIFYQGNAPGTILTGFYNEARQAFNAGGNENDLYPFGARLAYDANAIYFQDNQLTYDFAGNESATVQRTQTVNTFGGINEMVLSLAGNYAERLMVGATVGVPFVNYRLEGEYQENDPADNVDYFDNLRYTEYLRTQGIGVNFKLGFIYRVTQGLRFGGAFHTPTLMGLTDNYYNTFDFTYTDANGPNSSGEQRSPDGTTDYRLRTPWRTMLGLSYLFGRRGFLSGDLEVVDYGNNRYNLNADVPSAENELIERQLNQEIGRKYGTAYNLRFGGEVALDVFRLRAGLNLLGNPDEPSEFRTAYTAGAGVRGDAFFLDLAFRRTVGEGAITPYDGAPSAVLDSRNGEVLLTLGFKF